MTDWQPEDLCPARKPRGMSDEDYAAWFARSKARIEASLADPRPPISGEELDRRLKAYVKELYAKKRDAAA